MLDNLAGGPLLRPTLNAHDALDASGGCPPSPAALH